MAESDQRKPLRIAIFNDGSDTIAILSACFASHGHHPLSARLQDMRLADSEAAAFISRNKADVVVFDVGMPYQPNWDFAEVLRLLPGVTGIPFVFTSANTTELDKLVGPTGAYLLTGTPTNLSGLMALIDSTVGR